MQHDLFAAAQPPRKPSAPALYLKLKELVKQNPNLLQAYRRDFYVHDRRSLRTMKTGERWLWVLRRHGTCLFPIGVGQKPVWVTHWLDQDGPSCKTFLINISAEPGDGTVVEVNHQRARDLANEPPPKGIVAWQPTMFGMLLVRDGHEVAKAQSWNDAIVISAGSVILDRCRSWLDAYAFLERLYGPKPPGVCA